MIQTESGRVSRTVLIHLCIGIAGQLLALLGWLANILSPQAWAVVSGVLGTIQAIAGIYERLISGRAVGDGRRGEPMKPSVGRLTSGLFVMLVVALTSACGTTAEFTGAKVGLSARTGPPAEVTVTADGRERCKVVGDDGVPLRIRVFDCGRVEQIGGGLCLPPAGAEK